MRPIQEGSIQERLSVATVVWECFFIIAFLEKLSLPTSRVRLCFIRMEFWASFSRRVNTLYCVCVCTKYMNLICVCITRQGVAGLALTSCVLLRINPLNTKRRPLYLKTQFVPRRPLYVKTQFVPRRPLYLKTQFVPRRLLYLKTQFVDKYKTHKYSVGRAYNCWMLNCWCITWPVGFKSLRKRQPNPRCSVSTDEIKH